MSTDIVKRLAENIADYERMNQSGTLLADAKAEIERLREAVSFAVEWANGLPRNASDELRSRRVSNSDLEAFLVVMQL